MRETLKTAETLLRDYADSLHECHTIDDDWRGDVEAKDEWERLIKVASDLERLAQAGPVQVPAGWKLVPVEPTSKMIVAGAEADPQFFTHAQFVYRAMLAAAPEPEGGAA